MIKRIFPTLVLAFAFVLFLSYSHYASGQGQEELERQLLIIDYDENDDAIIDCSHPGETCIVRLPEE